MDAQVSSPLTVQIILTIATFGFAGIPVIADFNKTHATNPLWVGHARYHVVWQVLSYVLIGALALYLIWVPSQDAFFRLNLAALLGFAVYGGFFGAYLTMPMYSGKHADPDREEVFNRRQYFGLLRVYDRIDRRRIFDARLIAFAIESRTPPAHAGIRIE